MNDFEHFYKANSGDDGKDHVRFFHGIINGILFGGLMWVGLIYGIVLLFK